MSAAEPDPYKSPVELGQKTAKRRWWPLVVLVLIGGAVSGAMAFTALSVTPEVVDFGDMRRGPVEFDFEEFDQGASGIDAETLTPASE